MKKMTIVIHRPIVQGISFQCKVDRRFGNNKMIRKSYKDGNGKIVCPMNGANYLTLRGKLVNWTSEDILKVVKENSEQLEDITRESWESINEENKENNEVIEEVIEEDIKEENNSSNSYADIGDWETI